jgi:hypothetical protein
MARAIGEAKKEFEKAAREGISPARSPVMLPDQLPQDPIIVAAKSLGISTEGKTKVDLSQEILQKSTAS